MLLLLFSFFFLLVYFFLTSSYNKKLNAALVLMFLCRTFLHSVATVLLTMEEEYAHLLKPSATQPVLKIDAATPSNCSLFLFFPPLFVALFTSNL